MQNHKHETKTKKFYSDEVYGYGIYLPDAAVEHLRKLVTRHAPHLTLPAYDICLSVVFCGSPELPGQMAWILEKVAKNAQIPMKLERFIWDRKVAFVEVTLETTDVPLSYPGAMYVPLACAPDVESNRDIHKHIRRIRDLSYMNVPGMVNLGSREVQCHVKHMPHDVGEGSTSASSSSSSSS